MWNPGLAFNSLGRWMFRSVTNPRIPQTVVRSSSAVTNAVSSDYEPDDLYRKLNVEVRGNDPAVLKSYSWFATRAARELDIKVGECWAPRKPYRRRETVLKSVHIYKKHRVQYEIRTYYRHMEFLQLTGSTADTFLEYIQRNLPEGVAMKASKHRLERLPEHLKVLEKDNSSTVEPTTS